MNKEERSYTVIFETSAQFTQDEWRMITHSLNCSDQTTLGEIREWVNKSANTATDFHVNLKLVSNTNHLNKQDK